MANNPLPNPKRYITDNDADGQSLFSTSLPESLEVVGDLGSALQRIGYVTEEPPPFQLTNNTDLQAYELALKDKIPLVRPGGGANVWYIDTPPESESPMHRTVSFDIIIQVAGEVELSMSNDDKRIVKPGDMVIQRSTLHKWRNVSKTEWSRMVGILVECKPVVTEKGETLDTYFPSH